MAQAKRYTYKGADDKNHYIDLPNDLELQAKRARNRYTTSKKYIDAYFTYIWRWAHKAYSLSTSDRAKHIKSWQSNISVGVIRSFIDIMTSTLTERPITYNVQGLNDLGRKNKDHILHALTVTSDATKFHDEIRKALKEGLKTGMFAFRVGMYGDAMKHTIIDTTDPDLPKEVTFDASISNFPYAKTCDVFSVFPDFGKGPLQYVTERIVCSIETFIETFDGLVSSEDNKSPFKNLVQELALNKNGANFEDFGIVKYQIYQDINYQLYKEDGFNQNTPQSLQTPQSTGTHDIDDDANDGNVEVLFTVDRHKITIHMNGYPVYIGINPYGFVNYVMVSIQDKDMHVGCEGIPYLIRGPEQVLNSHMNTYIDGVRAVANPAFVYPKGAFLDENKLKDMPPGAVFAVEAQYKADAIHRIDKGTVSDFQIWDIMMNIMRQLIGVSEYNSGIAARERTATGSLAVTQSSQKRLSPFMEAFVAAISQVAHMQVRLMQDYWTDSEYMQAADINPDEMKSDIAMPSAKDLIGAFNISLELDGMFSAVEEMKSRKMLEIWNQLAGRNLIKEDAWVREMVRANGLSPEKYVPEDAPSVTTEAPTPLQTEGTDNPAIAAGQDLTALVSPQPNFGNEGQGQQ